MDIPLLPELVVILALCVSVMIVCLRLGLAPIIGYLAAGVLAGPGALGLVKSLHEVEMMAEIGVVLLLFTIGLELSASEVMRLKRPILLGGSLQLGLTGLFFLGLTLALGGSWGQAVFMGFLAALSSTAILLKELQNRSELESPQGRVALSILIAQDLAVVPMMLLVPLLAGKGMTLDAHAGVLLLKGAGVLAGVLLLAKFVVPRIFLAVARTRSRELFLLATMVFCLGVALLTAWVGLSLSLGAFIAGIMLSESEYAHNALEGVLPFKDVFTSLFFVSVGMLVDVPYILANPGQVLSMVAALLVLKAGAATLAGMALGYPLATAVMAGLALSQVGEFSFVLAKSGLDNALISRELYQLFLAGSVVTMAVTPWLLDAGHAVSRLIARHRPAKAPPPPNGTIKDHLIICGFGPTGKRMARAAGLAGIPYCILEMNIDTVRREAARGQPISFGDAAYPGVLEYAGVAEARVLVVAVSDPAAVLRIVGNAKRLNPRLRVIVRTRYEKEAEELRRMGADEVVPEEFEASIEMFTRMLAQFMVPRQTVERFITQARKNNYSMLRGSVMTADAMASLDPYLKGMDLLVLTVEAGSPLDGRTLAEAGLRRKHGLTVVAVARGGTVHVNPDSGLRLVAGDDAYVFGEKDDLSDKIWLFRPERPEGEDAASGGEV